MMFFRRKKEVEKVDAPLDGVIAASKGRLEAVLDRLEGRYGALDDDLREWHERAVERNLALLGKLNEVELVESFTARYEVYLRERKEI